jgi:hypothetical protein
MPNLGQSFDPRRVAPIGGLAQITANALHNVLRSSGTSPNFFNTFASLKSPVAGSPVQLNATAPTMTFLA